MTLHRLWPELVKCAERGGSTEAELREKIDQGLTLLWDAGDGLFALDLTTDDVCVAWLGVGRMAALLEQEKHIERFARAHGCRALRFEGRHGWRRVFRHWEYKGIIDGATRMEREL